MIADASYVQRFLIARLAIDAAQRASSEGSRQSAGGSRWSPGIHSPRYESCRLSAYERHGRIKGFLRSIPHLHAQEWRHEGRIVGFYRFPTQFPLQLFDALSCEGQFPELVPLANDRFQLVVAHGKALFLFGVILRTPTRITVWDSYSSPNFRNDQIVVH